MGNYKKNPLAKFCIRKIKKTDNNNFRNQNDKFTDRLQFSNHP